MSGVSDGLLRRLKALAEMAERGTEHEREIAAGRLAELMVKYQIESFDTASPEPQAEEGRLDADEGAPPSRVEHWEKMLLSSVAEVCGGRCWLRGRGRYQQLRMVGPKDSVGGARYMYLWLRRQVAEMSREAARTKGDGSNAWRRAYASGCVAKIYKRMKDARRVVVEQSQALVLVDRQKAAVDARFADLGELRTSKGGRLDRRHAATEGWVDGDRVDVGGHDQRQVGEGQKRLK